MVDNKQKTIIPFNYERISYYTETKVFVAGNKYSKEKTIYDTKGNLIFKGIFNDISEYTFDDIPEIKVLQLDKMHYFFNKNKVIGRVKYEGGYGYLYNKILNKNLFDIGLIRNQKNRRTFYSDFKTGTNFLQDNSFLENQK